MKKLFVLFLIVSSSTVFTFGQTNKHKTTDHATVRQALFKLRQTFFEAQRQGDRQELESLLSDSFYFVHSTGVLTSKKEFIDRTVSQAGKGPEVEFLDDQLFLFNNNTAVWLTRSVSRNPNGTELNFRATDVLVKGEKDGNGFQYTLQNCQP